LVVSNQAMRTLENGESTCVINVIVTR